MFYLGDVPCATQNYERVKNADWKNQILLKILHLWILQKNHNTI